MKTCRSETAVSRFFKKVELIPFYECWEWVGTKTKGGYGVFDPGGGNVSAHVAAWRLFKEQKLKKDRRRFHIHHTCENKSCVNPNHLVNISAKENVRISSPQVRRASCPKGHPYDRIELRGDGSFRARRCFECRRERNKKAQLKRRGIH